MLRALSVTLDWPATWAEEPLTPRALFALTG